MPRRTAVGLTISAVAGGIWLERWARETRATGAEDRVNGNGARQPEPQPGSTY